ncbi:hypothetical protein PHMEG_00030562 [Phytophthora megakarya]|uniref:Reverse transcriptase domain-containing protein n=1 Tax=Phytophthora megakarya TaxID=4795 RepID=A0A225V0Y8_9STRA|nr:hypothetical protein PHMEG_00030562 [Phytophthora megakarya]
MLVEAVFGLPPALGVARSLCTLENGQVIVEVCNASTQEYRIRKGTPIAMASAIPDSPFDYQSEVSARTPVPRDASRDDGARSLPSVAATLEERPEKASKTDPVEGSDASDSVVDVKADFSSSNLTDEQKELFQLELDQFKDIFVESSKKPGRTDLLRFEIDTGSSLPIKSQPYRVSGAEGEVKESEIQQYLDLGLIRESNSPWFSRKPDGGIRFCVDYLKLNAVTVKDCNPMPLIDDILNVWDDARLFSTMDIASGYWNVPMHENSVDKTAFTCKYGLYE